MKLLARLLVLVLAPFMAVQSAAQQPGLSIVEFRHAPTNKFFLTASESEKTLLDTLAGIGWQRTGITYSAWSAGQHANAHPVCRFFVPSVGSHFFSVRSEECAYVAGLAGFVAEGVAWYAAVPSSSDAATACPSGTSALYRTFNNGHTNPANGQSNHRYFTDYSFYQLYGERGYALEGLVMCLPLSEREKRTDAARLLHQATFGARPGDLERLLERGIETWLDEQLALPSSRYNEQEWWPLTRPDTCVNNTTPPLTATSYCQRDNYTLFQPQRQFFQQAISNPDQLRQRVAWAWSQLFVVSDVESIRPYGMIDYQQMLREHAFGNFRDLLQKMALHAAMGKMLDMANNQRPTASTKPNDNFARELLQLFTLGTVQLDLQGQPKRDGHGQALPTYSEDDVAALAHLFTGWTYPTVPGQTPRSGFNPINTKGFMEERSALHDPSPLTVLGQSIPSGLSQSQRLNRALDIIFQHPNVAPFISRFLIQQLVSGDPSPSYVERVARVFVDNGQGIRGDIKAVVRAILLDHEARGASKWAPNYGHLSEPALAVTRLARAMQARTDGVYFRNLTPGSGQTVFNAPSVFNYYSPFHRLPGGTVTAPEFGIYNTASAINRGNAAYNLIYTTINPDPTVFGATGTQVDLSPFTTLAGQPDRLLDSLAELLTAGRLSERSRQAIRQAIEAIPTSDALNRVRMALYLTALAPAGQVLR